MEINFSSRECNVKIVYYGPGLSGKTTNLKVIHERTPEDNRGNLTQLATDLDRTLFFDYMPLDIGEINGLKVRLRLYTVPGQVYYTATRKLVLRCVDGIVMVADSQEYKKEENLKCIEDLKTNLAEYGLGVHDVPIVFQFNKRDLPNVMPLEMMESVLNYEIKAPCFPAVAVKGDGVFQCLKAIANLTMAKVEENIKNRSKVKPDDSKKKTQAIGVPVPPAVRPVPGMNPNTNQNPLPLPNTTMVNQPGVALNTIRKPPPEVMPPMAQRKTLADQPLPNPQNPNKLRFALGQSMPKKEQEIAENQAGQHPNEHPTPAVAHSLPLGQYRPSEGTTPMGKKIGVIQQPGGAVEPHQTVLKNRLAEDVPGFSLGYKRNAAEKSRNAHEASPSQGMPAVMGNNPENQYAKSGKTPPYGMPGVPMPGISENQYAKSGKTPPYGIPGVAENQYAKTGKTMSYPVGTQGTPPQGVKIPTVSAQGTPPQGVRIPTISAQGTPPQGVSKVTPSPMQGTPPPGVQPALPAIKGFSFHGKDTKK